MVLISLMVSQIYIWLKKSELNYRTLAITGILVIALGDLLHIFLSPAFGIELIKGNRRAGIIIFEGAVWFPAFLIIAGNRKEIFTRFKAYERRLIIATRARSRTSADFKELQVASQERIKGDLLALSASLKGKIVKFLESAAPLTEINQLVAPELLGHELRKLSVALDSTSTVVSVHGTLRKKFDSLLIFFQQFKILYISAIRQSALPQSTYVVILVGLVTPLYIYFYTFTEALTEFPILLLTVAALSKVIHKMHLKGSSRSIVIASIFIFLTGLLPLFLDLFGEPFESKNGNHFPFVITLFVLPMTYFIFMELFQVLRPTALKLLEGDELEASAVLQTRVSKIVSDEFSSNLSHQWAVYIHGKILTRLAATALKLESCSKSGDEKMFHGAIDSLLALLSAPDEVFGSESKTLQSEINSRLDPWKGLLEISLSVDPDLIAVTNPRVRDLGDVIEELISNSIRHGKAHNIELQVIHAEESDVHIISIDDATIAPPLIQIRSGLGTRIFNLASDGRWSIARLGDSTEFRLTMAL